LQIIFNPKCSAQEYSSQGRLFAFPDLTAMLCPLCEGDFLHRHGFYARNFVTAGFDGRILIRRHICPICKRTVSSLPAFAHPRRTYGIAFIIGVLGEYYLKAKGAVAAATSFAVATATSCSRQLLRWFRIRIETNAEVLAMSLKEVLSLRAPPWSGDGKEGAVRQILEALRGLSPEEVSADLFTQTKRSYLT
jgi:hypothetical protein